MATPSPRITTTLSAYVETLVTWVSEYIAASPPATATSPTPRQSRAATREPKTMTSRMRAAGMETSARCRSCSLRMPKALLRATSPAAWTVRMLEWTWARRLGKALVASAKLGLIPAVTHVDGTTRLQTVDRENNPVFHEVIEEFARITGVPLLLNTSLNESEPIVCSPADALRTCLSAGVDYLAIESHIVDIAKCHASVAALLDVPPAGRDTIPQPQLPPESADAEPALDEDVVALFMSR